MERREKRDEQKKKEKSNYSFLILYRYRYRFRIFHVSIVEEKYKMYLTLTYDILYSLLFISLHE